MATRTFSFQEGSSSKFWEVGIAGPQLTIRFGRIGATGQTQVKSFTSASAAAAEAEALIRSKVKKGYVEGGAAPGAKKKSATPRRASKTNARLEAFQLLAAFQRSKVDKVKSLIEAGADVNTPLPGGSPLHRAASQELLELVEFLIARGANVEARDDRKRTPYMKTGSPTIRAALKKAGAKGLDSVNGYALRPRAKKGKLAEAEVDGAALGVDAKGNLWFADNAGVHRWDGKALTRFDFDESFSVERILPGTKGVLFFSTNWGIVTFDGKVWRLISPEASELHDQHITDFAVDRNGIAYALGYGSEETLDRPISRYDGKAVTVLLPGVDLPKGLETKTIAFDAKNQIHFLTSEGVHFPDGKKWFPGGNEVNRLMFDGATLWADCGYSALYRRTPSGTKKFSFEDGVEALALAGKTMWVGNFGGLHYIDGDKATKLDGFFAGGVEALALGKGGTLWVSSDAKVFSVTKGVVRSLDGKTIEAQRDEDDENED